MERPMEAQKLLDAAPFDPDVVKTLQRAFDEAWARIRSTIPTDRVNDTRLSLAHALVAHAANGERDRAALKVAALEAVQKNPPRKRSGKAVRRTR